jgi:hypothetical protein
MRASGHTVDGFAQRLVARLDDPERFRTDPAEAIEASFGVTVRFRDAVDSDCDLIDGSCDYENGIITVANALSPGRRRFTALHELGHYLGKSDNELQDWLFERDDLGRLEEERVANAFAGMVLLPAGVVNQYIPDEGPTAHDVAMLAAEKIASREAVCVRASQRLRGAGLVVLSQGSVVQFAASRSLPYGLARGVDQGDASFFVRAAARGMAREDGVRLVLRSGDLSDPLMADAVADDAGYVFSVLMRDAAPWKALTPIAHGDDGMFEVDCEQCDRVRLTGARECPVCHDRPCPDHGCSCDQQPARGREARRCTGCNVKLPIGAPATTTLCDVCG